MTAVISKTSRQQPRPVEGRRLRVAMVAPSYPRASCGIATYTGYLATALGPLADVVVVGEQETQAIGLTRAVMAAARNADVVHVQHTFELYGWHGWRSFPLYTTLARVGVAVVTTMHELPEALPRSLKARAILPYLRTVMQQIAHGSRTVVLHTHEAQARFSAWKPHATCV